jgi:hypothetical protein
MTARTLLNETRKILQDYSELKAWAELRNTHCVRVIVENKCESDFIFNRVDDCFIKLNELARIAGYQIKVDDDWLDFQRYPA